MPQTPPQTDTYNTALDIFDRTHPLRVDADENLKVTGTFTPSGTQDVNIVGSVPIPVTQSGTWTVNLATEPTIDIGIVDQGTGGTSPWLINVNNFPAIQPVSQSGTWTTGRTWALLNTTDSVNVGNFPATQPVSGTVTTNQGTSPWVVSGSITTSPNVNLHDGAGNSITSTSGALDVAVSFPGSITVTQGTSPWVTSVSNFPATQPVSGTVTALQGTSPWTVDGTVNAIQSGVWTTGRTWTLSSGTDSLAAVQSGSWIVTANQGTSPWVVSGTVTANAGTNLNTSALALDATLTNSTQKTQIVQGGNTAVVDATGDLQVDVNNFPATQTVAGTVTANQGTSPWVVSGTVTANAGTGNFTVVQPTGTSLHTVVDSGTIAATQSGTWTTGRTWTLASGTDSVSAVQSGTWTVQPGNTPNTSPWLIEQRAPGTLTSYSAATLGLVAAATPTDIFTIYGSGTKTIRVTRVEISATQNTAAIRDIVLIKRSAANTGGTSTAPTIVPYDSNNAAATATVLAYTANPTSLGASVGNVRTAKMDIPAANLVGNTDRIIWSFGDRPSQTLVLRGTSQGLAINLNSVTSASNSFDITVEWTEE